LLFLSSLFFLFFNAYPQFVENIKNSLATKPKIFVSFNSTGSFVSNKNANVYSIKAGLNFNKTIKLGIAYNWLNSDIKKNIIVNNDTLTDYLKLNYLSIFTEYVIMNNKNVEVYMPIILGAGKTSYIYYFNNKKYTDVSTFAILYENHLIATYKFLKYFGIGGGLGYRLMLKGSNTVGNHFTSLIYIVKFKIYFSELADDSKKMFN